MSQSLRVRMVEDSVDDAVLTLAELRAGGYEPVYERVETAEEMRAALAEGQWDTILADCALPDFSGTEAVEVLRGSGLDIPCIVVTGTVGEEGAVDLMRAGARDLVLKEHLARLVPAVQRELREAESRRERRKEHQELEEARRRLLEAEVEKRRFYREIIRAVTHDKFLLVDAGEVPLEGDCVLDLSLDRAESYAAFRRGAKKIAEAAGMSSEGAYDLVLAVGEAATNAIKHAGGGRCVVYTTPGSIIARVSDRGDGIHTENLPAMISHTGFSTKASLGMGYTIMLELMDRVWLATGPEGTTVQLEKCIQAAAHEELVVMPATWERL